MCNSLPTDSWGRVDNTTNLSVPKHWKLMLFLFQVLLEGVYSSCEENRIRECIRKVQENT